MAEKMLPVYPVYMPSKNRADRCITAGHLIKDGVPFHLVVEPSQVEAYTAAGYEKWLLVLPRDGMRLLGARNWIKEHSIANGDKRHWQLDDNMAGFKRYNKGERIHCVSGVALRMPEIFVDRYKNVAIAGLNYSMFAVYPATPFVLNAHVYSCSLILNEIPHKWRLLYNDDTDMCLQVLADGWCTIQFNAYLCQKIGTMVVKGGNTEDLYQGDGRLEMAKSLERMWPGVVTTKRRFNRPQHVIHSSWRKFDNKLIPIDGLKVKPGTDEHGQKLVQRADEIRSQDVRDILEEANRG